MRVCLSILGLYFGAKRLLLRKSFANPYFTKVILKSGMAIPRALAFLFMIVSALCSFSICVVSDFMFRCLVH